MIIKSQQIFYVDTIPTAAIGKEKDIAVHSNGNMYVKKGGRWIVLSISSDGNNMRGVAVFVQTIEPENPQLNDIWILI